MRSNSWRDLATLGVALAAVFILSLERERLAYDFHDLRVNADTYLLPARQQTVVMSLGYRSAVADLIFGHLLVSYGLHFKDKRLFEYVGDYIETINELDPKFRDPYRFADTLLTLQPKAPPEEFYRRARRIQERGLKELPYDQELWFTTGQFLAYLAPQRLSSDAEKEEYRQTGARYLSRACELVGSNENIPYHCITAANLFNKQGNLEAMRNFLSKVMTVSDDPEIQQLAAGYLKKIAGAEAEDKISGRLERFRAAWKADLGFVPRTEMAALFPKFDSAACAGLHDPPDQDCFASWRNWSAALDRAEP